MTTNDNEIVVYEPDETIRLDVRLDDDTVWLTQNQMTDLFQRDRTVITRHINNVFSEGELDEKSNVHFLHIPFSDKPVKVYSLNVIISVGYRVKSIRGTQFRIWATNVLREYLLRGYTFNTRLNQLEDKVERRLAKHDDRIATLEQKVDFFVQTKEPPLQSIFYQNKFWDAKSLLIKFIRRAKKELIVIDPYVGVATLDMLAKRGRGVTIELVTHSNGELEESDFEAFGKQCGKFTKTICGICHDRFIIVDQKEIFWKMRRRNAYAFRRGDSAKAEPEGRTGVRGASLKDAGRLTFAAAKMGAEIIPGLLESIRKATSERREYGKGRAKSRG